jgi:SAM-dependent methyltransferase
MSSSPLAQPEPWTLVADAYTAEMEPQFALYARDALALAELPARGRVVDVATGPGTLAMLAAAAGHAVSAVDFSPQMIENFRARLAAPGAPAIDARVADGQALPFADADFDGAFSMFGLMFFPDRAAGFRELLRVLRPGGRAVVSSWAPFLGPFALLFETLRAMLPDVPFAGGKPPLGTAEEMSSEMTGAGFADVTVRTVAHTLRAPSLSAFWASVQRTNVQLVLLQRKLGPVRWAKDGVAIYERLRSQLGDGEVSAVGTAYVGMGRKR